MIESTSVLLKRLDNKDLALEPTQKVPVVRGEQPSQKGAKPQAAARKDAPQPKESAVRHPALQRERRRDGGGGFDPYNSR